MIVDWYDGFILAHYPIVPQYRFNEHKVMAFLKVWSKFLGIRNRFQFVKKNRSLWYERVF